MNTMENYYIQFFRQYDMIIKKQTKNLKKSPVRNNQ